MQTTLRFTVWTLGGTRARVKGLVQGNAAATASFDRGDGRRWSAELELVGAGGEPVDLWRTLTSHGVADLPPSVIDEEARTLQTTLALPRGRARTIRIRGGRPGFALVEGENIEARDAVALADAARHLLRLDADLSAFYETARADPDLDWASAGGRMIRSPTVFEDVVKTI